jgi:hypothetical protein
LRWGDLGLKFYKREIGKNARWRDKWEEEEEDLQEGLKVYQRCITASI